MSATELKPCPFCGNRNVEVIDSASQLIDEWGEEGWGQEEAVEYLRKHPSYAVCCPMNDGGCGAVSGWSIVKEWSVVWWNRRADHD